MTATPTARVLWDWTHWRNYCAHHINIRIASIRGSRTSVSVILLDCLDHYFCISDGLLFPWRSLGFCSCNFKSIACLGVQISICNSDCIFFKNKTVGNLFGGHGAWSSLDCNTCASHKKGLGGFSLRGSDDAQQTLYHSYLTYLRATPGAFIGSSGN